MTRHPLHQFNNSPFPIYLLQGRPKILGYSLQMDFNLFATIKPVHFCDNLIVLLFGHLYRRLPNVVQTVATIAKITAREHRCTQQEARIDINRVTLT